MQDALGPDTQLGYCTNVHAGASLAATRDNLERYALAVKSEVCPDRPMGIGLWLADQAARELAAPGQTDTFAGWLADRGLFPFTLNGFPYGDFHERVVKHRVYQPDWTTVERKRHTIDLIVILARLLGTATEGSISTLPLGWRAPFAARPERVELAARNLLDVADHLRRVEDETGKLIHVDIEPEPGCVLDTSEDVVRFFKEHLLPGEDEDVVRRYLRVCHDVCHAAVMFEDQTRALRRYAEEGIGVGKVQLSSAVRVRFDRTDAGEVIDRIGRQAALTELSRFAEDRYLHQTMIQRRGQCPEFTFHDDLVEALRDAQADGAPVGEWRVHFHVPLFLDRVGPIETTRQDLIEALAASLAANVRHFEAETYAWDVLPAELRNGDLASGVARELTWLQELSNAQTTA